MRRMDVSVSHKTSALKESPVLSGVHLALSELRAEQAFVGPRADVAVHTYAMKNGRIQDLFSRFCEKSFPITLLHGDRFLQLKLDISHKKVKIRYEMVVLIALMVNVCSYTMALPSTEVRWKQL